MREPIAYLAYASNERKLLCAVVLITVENNVYGWYTGPQAAGLAASFFVLENFYSSRKTVFYRSLQDDVHDGWAIVTPDGETEAGRSVPVPQELCHELEHMQSAFAQEWLFYADDPAAREEMESYRRQTLPVLAVNIKARKLNKLAHTGAVWTYSTPGLDLNVIDFMKGQWSLDYSN